MGRLIGGIVLVVIGIIGIFGTLTSGLDNPLIAVLVLLVIIVVGVALAYWGYRYVASRQRVLPVLERMAREGSVIDTPAVSQETGVSVDLVRQHVQYAKMRGYIDRNLEVK